MRIPGKFSDHHISQKTNASHFTFLLVSSFLFLFFFFRHQSGNSIVPYFFLSLVFPLGVSTSPGSPHVRNKSGEGKPVTLSASLVPLSSRLR